MDLYFPLAVTDELELTRILKSESKHLVVLKKVGINHSNWYQKVCLTKWFYCAGNIGAKQQASYLRLRNGINADQMRSLVSLPLQMKPLGEVTLTNIGGQEQHTIQKRKLCLISAFNN